MKKKKCLKFSLYQKDFLKTFKIVFHFLEKYFYGKNKKPNTSDIYEFIRKYKYKICNNYLKDLEKFLLKFANEIYFDEEEVFDFETEIFK
ncbi:MAG: hypothetical protein ACO2O4_03235 [Minisyncoccia bacterium]